MENRHLKRMICVILFSHCLSSLFSEVAHHAPLITENSGWGLSWRASQTRVHEMSPAHTPEASIEQLKVLKNLVLSQKLESVSRTIAKSGIPFMLPQKVIWISLWKGSYTCGLAENRLFQIKYINIFINITSLIIKFNSFYIMDFLRLHVQQPHSLFKNGNRWN